MLGNRGLGRGGGRGGGQGRHARGGARGGGPPVLAFDDDDEDDAPIVPALVAPVMIPPPIPVAPVLAPPMIIGINQIDLNAVIPPPPGFAIANIQLVNPDVDLNVMPDPE